MSTVINQPSTYVPQSTFPEVKFKLTDLNPPSNLYVTREDTLVVQSNNSAAGVTVEVHGRMLLPNGIVVPFVQAHVPNTDRTSKTDVFPIPEGFLLNLTALLASGTARRGQCYVVVKLGRGDKAARTDHHIMLQGYVGSGVNQAWPGNALQTPTEGPGFIRYITGTQPAAGVDISEVVPTGARWRLISMIATLTTSAAAGTRQVVFRADNGVSAFSQSAAPTTQPISVGYTYEFAPGQMLGTAPSVTNPAVGLPTYLMLFAGFRIQTVTASIQATDQWGAPQYCVEEWIEL